MRIFVDEYAVKDIMRQTTQQGMVDALVKVLLIDAVVVLHSSKS